MLGAIVHKILNQGPGAHLLGVTSRGAFVCTESDQVLFLSEESYAGPLTLNLVQNPVVLSQIKPGCLVSIQKGCLFFHGTEVWLSTDQAMEWNPPPSPVTPLSSSQRLPRLDWAIQQSNSQYSDFTPAELGVLQLALQTKQSVAILKSLQPILGRGNGLTPAGDDLVIGLLLTFNRWRSWLYKDFPVEQINRLITQAARVYTTALSASLIECATQGQADERLINALDSLVTGAPDLEACISRLLSWGSSSGEYVLRGMTLALNLPSRTGG